MDTPQLSKEMEQPRISHEDLAADAQEATIREHELTIRQAMRLYPKAIAWSLVLSAASIMDGYDLHVMGLLLAQPAFQKAYGQRQPDGTYQISAAWQSGLNNASAVGALVGLYMAGYLSDKLGFRRTIMIALFFAVCFIFVQFFSNSLTVYVIGHILTSEWQCCGSLGSFLLMLTSYRYTCLCISNHYLRLRSGCCTNLPAGLSDELCQPKLGKTGNT